MIHIEGTAAALQLKSCSGIEFVKEIQRKFFLLLIFKDNDDNKI